MANLLVWILTTKSRRIRRRAEFRAAVAEARLAMVKKMEN